MTESRTVNERLAAIEAGQTSLQADVAELKDGQKRLETRVGNLETGQTALQADVAELKDGQKRLETRVGNLETGQENLAAGQKNLEVRTGNLEAGQKRLEDGQARLEQAIASIRADIGPLKAAHARNSALRVSYRICEELGLDEVKVLSRDDLRAMVRRSDTSDIPRNRRYSFIEADAIIEAIDDAAETHYVAMEASFTADERDTDRAVRNADYLTRFTGRPAHAVIAAHRIDDRIAAIVSSGTVQWCRLDERDLEID